MILVNSFGSKTQDIPIFDSLDNEFDRITQILETVSDYHETVFDENKPIMTDIYNCLPLLEYQKDFIRYGLRVFRECLLYQNNVQEKIFR